MCFITLRRSIDSTPTNCDWPLQLALTAAYDSCKMAFQIPFKTVVRGNRAGHVVRSVVADVHIAAYKIVFTKLRSCDSINTSSKCYNSFVVQNGVAIVERRPARALSKCCCCCCCRCLDAKLHTGISSPVPNKSTASEKCL